MFIWELNAGWLLFVELSIEQLQVLLDENKLINKLMAFNLVANWNLKVIDTFGPCLILIVIVLSNQE